LSPAGSAAFTSCPVPVWPPERSVGVPVGVSVGVSVGVPVGVSVGVPVGGLSGGPCGCLSGGLSGGPCGPADVLITVHPPSRALLTPAPLRLLEDVLFLCGCEVRWLQLWQQRGEAGLSSQRLYCADGETRIPLEDMSISSCGETHTHTLTHRHTHTHTHTQTHSHSHTLTLTHRHTHTPLEDVSHVTSDL